MKARGLDLNLPKSGDYEEWRALREMSSQNLAGVEPGWSDHKLSREFFAAYVAESADAAEEGSGYSMTIRNGAGALVGGVSLGPIKQGLGMLGVWIGAPFVGRGFAVKAVDATLEAAFRVIGLQMVAATVLAENEPSLRILEYFGFEHDPARNIVMHIGDQPRLHLIYTVNAHGYNYSPAKQRERDVFRQRAA